MPADKPIQVAKLRWKKNTSDARFFGAIQVVLSNGVESPVFLGKTQNTQDMIEVLITPSIRKIRGTNNANWLYQIIFQSKEGQELQRMESYASNQFANDQVLAEGQEILGVYGTKDLNGNGCFNSLGFIVWVPPKF